MCKFPSTADDSCSSIHNTLQFFKVNIWSTIQQRVAVVQARCNECMDNPLTTILRQIPTDSYQMANMQESSFTQGLNMPL
jgi:hypothetical protein